MTPKNFFKLFFLLPLSGAVSLEAQSLSAGDIEKMISDAAGAKKKEVTIPKGVYRIKAPSSKGHLFIKDVSDLKINAEGVTIICLQITRALTMENCTRVELSGLTIDYDPLPFTQGKVVATGTDADGFIDVKIDVGYPEPVEGVYTLPADKLEIYDAKTRRLKNEFQDLFNKPVKSLGDGVFRIEKVRSGKDWAKPGDLAAISLDGKNQTSHAVRVENSAEIVLRDITVLAAPSFGFNDSSADFVSYIGCKVTPGPKPEGATEARLKSSTADGIHSSTARRGPLVENCLVENNGDDGIAIHGYFSPLYRAEGMTVTVGPRGGIARTPYQIGEKLYLVHLESGEYYGSALIKSFKVVDDKSEVADLIKLGPTLKLRDYKGYKEFAVLQLEKADLKAGESIQAGDIVCGANTTGNGFVVRNNTVRNLRARGINIKASEGVVEGNTADYCAQAGIIFCPGLYFLEAFFAQNVVIKNNLIRESGYAKSNPDNRLGGAFTMAAEGLKGEYPAAGNHRNVVIEGNIFERCYGVNLQITSTLGVSVKNNQFRDSHPEARLHATKRGVDPKKLIWVDTTDGIEFEGNTYERIGPAGDEDPLYLGKSVVNAKGAAGGLKKK